MSALVTHNRPGSPQQHHAGILEILEMDGRHRAPDIFPFASRTSQRPSVASVKQTIQVFEDRGGTNHSAARVLLPYVIAYCEAKGYSYNLDCLADQNGRVIGYYLQKGSMAPVSDIVVKAPETP
jgi:hypothetical protein